MEFFLIYLLVMCESLASVIGGFGALIPAGVILIVCVYLINGMASIDDKIEDAWAVRLNKPLNKRLRKIGTTLLVIGLICTATSKLIPNQKELAVIVGAGVTYQAVTSETGKRIGGKAVELLEQKIDSVLSDKMPVVPEKTQGKAL